MQTIFSESAQVYLKPVEVSLVLVIIEPVGPTDIPAPKSGAYRWPAIPVPRGG